MTSGPTLSGATAILTTTSGALATDTAVSIQLSGRIFQSLDVVLANRQGICRTGVGRAGSARAERYALDITSIPLSSLGAELTLRIDWTAGDAPASVELDLELELADDVPTRQCTRHHVGTLRFDDDRHSLTSTLPRSELIPR